MTLIKTSVLSAIAVLVRVLTSLVLNKILAVYVGAAGYAVIGQFQNVVNMLTTLASGAVNTGVTKYTAEHFDDEERQIYVWRTAGTIALTGSVILGSLIAALHDPLARWIVKDELFAGVFVWLGLGILPLTLNGLFLAILNGKKEIRKFVVINIAGSLFGLAITGGLAISWGLYGALVALAINQSIVFAITLALCWHAPWFQARNLIGRLHPPALRALVKFALMALVSAACMPIAHILIRNHLGANFGWEAAGHWEALMRISSLYLMIVTTPLAVYYLPRIAEIRDDTELKREILQGYRILLPMAAFGAFTIYVLRDWLVTILFTAEFAPMRALFAWQMAGDTVKIGSWLLGYVLLGKAMIKAFIISEVLFTISWVGMVWLMTASYGENGAQIAYFVSYVLYWLLISFLVLRRTR